MKGNIHFVPLYQSLVRTLTDRHRSLLVPPESSENICGKSGGAGQFTAAMTSTRSKVAYLSDDDYDELFQSAILIASRRNATHLGDSSQLTKSRPIRVV